MYVLKQIDQTWTEECLRSIFCWMSCILWVLGGPQALLPAPKPQCITLSPTKFLNIEKMILKSCALWHALGRRETKALCVGPSTSPAPEIPCCGISRGSGPGVKPPQQTVSLPSPSLVPLIQPSEPHPTGGSGEPASRMKTFKLQGEVELDSNLVCLHPKSVRVFSLFVWGSLLGFSTSSRMLCSGKQSFFNF